MPAGLIKKMVSKNKRRFKQDGFDLDLTYICSNIIAMGFPAEKIEGVYRNHVSDVVRFLNSKHREHYKVFNLCSERIYDPRKFHRVVSFPFDDHHPPPLRLMTEFCLELDKWLSADDRNVAAVHCKAGKGRTGVMICAYLLHCGHTKTAMEVLDFYGKTRTKDGKGVTIPSQRRYVRYYELQLHKQPLAVRQVQMTALQLCPVPTPSSGTACTPSFAVYKDQQKLFPSPGLELRRESSSSAWLSLSQPLMLVDDICIEVFHKPHKLSKKEKLFHFWFNTAFIPPYNQRNGQALRGAPESDPNLTHVTNGVGALSLHTCLPPHVTDNDLALVLPKCELDRANKDKSHKIYSDDFKVVVYFRSLSVREPRPVEPVRPLVSGAVFDPGAMGARLAQVPSVPVMPTSRADRSLQTLAPKPVTADLSPASAHRAISEDELSDVSSVDEWAEAELSSRV